MKVEIDLLSPGWPHIIFLLITLLSIPEISKKLTSLSVWIFSQFYRIANWFSKQKLFTKLVSCCKKSTQNDEERLKVEIEQIQNEKKFKLLSPAEVADQLEQDTRYDNISGYVSFKWGFPYIFRTRHLQLFQTDLLIRDSNEMKKYTQKRLNLLKEQYKQQHNNSIQSTSTPTTTTTTITTTTTANDEIDNFDNQSSLLPNSLIPVTSRTLPPPKPLFIFNFSNGKVINSRLPMTLKLVNVNSEACYLQFSNRSSYAYWCKAFEKNLHVELVHKWKSDANIMLGKMHHEKNLEKLQTGTPVKKRPVLGITNVNDGVL
jgi:hypothetical protein